ncbi:MAG TPA: hypothetical protein VJV21_08005 [Pyrinomonadaceae bacterium]|nr:hypothetical protein [Pyrinomonadaceae bacterium]
MKTAIHQPERQPHSAIAERYEHDVSKRVLVLTLDEMHHLRDNWRDGRF